MIAIQPEPPAQRHSLTSTEAAERIRPDANTLRMAVYRHLLAAGDDGLTDEQMQEGIPMQPSTQRPRRIELVGMGLARDSGRTRPTRSGRKATVWVAIQQEEPIVIVERVTVPGRLF